MAKVAIILAPLLTKLASLFYLLSRPGEELLPYIEDNITWNRRRQGVRLLDGSIWLGRISGDGAARIAEPHSRVLVRCYIDPADLHRIANSDGVSPSKLFETKVLPDKPQLRSGDSGEILARSVLRERDDQPVFPVYRWRYRSNRDDTVKGPDLLGYVMSDPNEPTDDDVLVVCEVKTRAITTRDAVVLDAYQGATANYISSLKNHLFFARQKLLLQANSTHEARLARFANPHKQPYIRRLVPCVVHNDQTWDNAFLDFLPVQHGLSDEVEVVIICVDNLATWITEVFDTAIAAADDLDALAKD